ncbi:hypothetical protein BGX26_002002, partial [Mortierella sp. AD094]
MTTFSTGSVTNSKEINAFGGDWTAFADRQLLRMLGSRSLTRLSLTKLQSGGMNLNAVLECCPTLTHLCIEYEPLSDYVIWQDALFSDSTQRRLSLQSLSLRNVKMDQDSLEALLRRCHMLRCLEIVFLRPVLSTSTTTMTAEESGLQSNGLNGGLFPNSLQPDLSTITNTLASLNVTSTTMATTTTDGDDPLSDGFSGVHFFNSILVSCPYIRSLQFSLNNRPMTHRETMTLVGCFPELSTFGSSSADFAQLPAGFRILDHYTNNLTVLEIHSSKNQPNGHDGQPGKTSVPALHSFLCASPLLLHLRAKGAVYNSSMFMDFTWRNVKAEGNVWACHNLQTLQLTFLEPWAREDWSEVHSRVLFGYISRVCPKLKELWIYRPGVSLKLEGGLCLLTRCKDLESLTIKTGRLDGLATSTVSLDWIAEWIGNHPNIFTGIKRRWMYSRLVMKTTKHEHGIFFIREDEICEACTTEQIPKLNKTSQANQETSDSHRSGGSPRASTRKSSAEGTMDGISLPVPSQLSSEWLSIEALQKMGGLQEVVDWMEDEPGFSSGSFECWPRLRSFKLGIHVTISNKALWVWKNKAE